MERLEVNCETGEIITIVMTDEEISLLLIPIAPSYTELRANEYPDFKLYLDGIIKGDATQVQDYIDACLVVKLKYPKA